MDRYDVAIVGAGALGLAHAYAAAKRGLRVVVIERNPRASGASVRNFGMIWTIGQWGTPMQDVATESNAIWRELLLQSGIWHSPCGCLTLAYEEDELGVLEEFHSAAKLSTATLLSPKEVLSLSPWVRPTGLLGGLLSTQEIHVDPREAISKIPAFLEERFGADFRWNTCVTEVNSEGLIAARKQIRAERVVLCSGDDYQTLFSDHFAQSGLNRCKLQMLRAEPRGTLDIGPMLCAGLTLLHYRNFENCPTLGQVRQRMQREWPGQMEHGIHLLVSQHANGEMVIGDTHEYGLDVSPFNRDSLDSLVLDYLNTFLPVPEIEVTLRWHGVYSTFSGAQVYENDIEPGIQVVTGVGGAGMTLSMGLGERTVSTWFA